MAGRKVELNLSLDENLLQTRNLNVLWTAAWFGITIWILTTALAPTYSVLAFLLILRLAVSQKSHRGDGLVYRLIGIAPAILVGVALTVYSWNLLNAATTGTTAYTVAQCLAGLALSGLILSFLIPMTDIKPMKEKMEQTKKRSQSWMAFKWIYAVWTATWFALAIWIFTSWPTYSVSMLLLVLTLGKHDHWLHLAQVALVRGAFVGYVVLVENSTNSAPWIAILVMAVIALAANVAQMLTKGVVEGWFQKAVKSTVFEVPYQALNETRDALGLGKDDIDFSGSKMPMSVPRTGLRKK